MQIPFVDLKIQYQAIKPEIDQAIRGVVKNTSFILGPAVEDFEKKFARYCDVKYCLGLNSGTSALYLILRALDIGPGDEVITAANTFFATAEAISIAGARPVFVDVEEATGLMDVSQLKAAITSRTKAIIPVHLYGQTTDMKPILALARQHKLYVIEDACQAHGATYQAKKAGSFSKAAAFSFYPGKNLGAYGEAGAVTTNCARTAQKIRMLRDHGSPKKYWHNLIGFNMRLEGIQGAVLGVKLKHLDKWNRKRRKAAAQYNKLLAGLPLVVPPYSDDYIFHLYVIRTKKRNQLQQFLSDQAIATGIHYPRPIHLQKAYADLGYQRGDFPVSEKLAEEILSLPMFPEISKEQINFVVDKIKEFFS